MSTVSSAPYEYIMRCILTPLLPGCRFSFPRVYRCVFYGDLYPNKECYDARIESGLSRLLAARRRFAYGTRTDYFEQHNCIGFVRAGSRLDIGEGKQERGRPGCVVLVSNAERWRVIPTLAGKKGEGKDADTLVEDTPVEDTLDADTLNADSRRAESDG